MEWKPGLDGRIGGVLLREIFIVDVGEYVL
jgi:hypothetical protein